MRRILQRVPGLAPLLRALHRYLVELRRFILYGLAAARLRQPLAALFLLILAPALALYVLRAKPSGRPTISHFQYTLH